ncbi:MAG: cellulase family glycosylhydrolase, partial [Lachnospiraceae bacterium]|nr:cellulase family glycosylhydrolase [Lachnospiraceae bacterium]
MKFKKTALILAMTLVLGACGRNADADPVPFPEETQQVQDDTETVTPAEETVGPEEPAADPEPVTEPESVVEEPLTFIEDMGTTTINGYTVKPVPDTDAFEFVLGMHGGINLGNAFDASDCNWVANELDYESAWCGARTTYAYIDSLCNEGFNVIRIPVSWHNHVDANYNISQAWLARVTEIVDYCLGKDMYVIINIHHDTDKNYFYPDSAHLDKTLKYTEAIWSQLAEHFG